MRWLLPVLLLGCAQSLPPTTRDGSHGGALDLRPAGDGGGGKDGGDGSDGGVDLRAVLDLAEGAQADLAKSPDLAAALDLAVAPDLLVAADLLNCAAVENCFNDSDDDCDGKVNNGCPVSVTVGTGVALPTVGGAGGGSGSTRCPTGMFAGAVRYFYDDYDQHMAGMGMFCTTPTLQKGVSSYSIVVNDIATGVTPVNFYGTGEDYFDESENCVAGGVLGTVLVHSILGANGTGSGYVDGLKTRCGAGTVTLGSDNQLTISFTATGSYTGWYYVSGTATVETCPAGAVLVGYDYRTGSWLDAIAPVCAPLVVTYE